MNEQLQQALADVLIGATKTMGDAKDFLVAEVPDVAQQALSFYGIYHGSLAILGVLLLLFQFPYHYLLKRYAASYERRISNNAEFTYFIGHGIGGIILFIAACVSLNLTWLKIWIAPKLWLIEFAGTLIK